jgi:PASTA domain
LANDRVVPRVIDLPRDDANEKVIERDLVPVFNGSDDLNAFVFRQSPPPNTPVPRRSPVRMTMQSGGIP